MFTGAEMRTMIYINLYNNFDPGPYLVFGTWLGIVCSAVAFHLCGPV